MVFTQEAVLITAHGMCLLYSASVGIESVLLLLKFATITSKVSSA